MFEKLFLVFFAYNLIIDTLDFSFSLVGRKIGTFPKGGGANNLYMSRPVNKVIRERYNGLPVVQPP